MSLDNYIRKLTEELPDLVSDKDLLRLKIFNSKHCLWKARYDGRSLPYLKLGKRVRYLKSDVINWLKNSYKTNEAVSDEAKDEL